MLICLAVTQKSQRRLLAVAFSSTEKRSQFLRSVTEGVLCSIIIDPELGMLINTYVFCPFIEKVTQRFPSLPLGGALGQPKLPPSTWLTLKGRPLVACPFR